MGRRLLIVLMCAGAAAAAGTWSARASAAGWSAVSMPTSRYGDVDSLACASANLCFVLGNGSGFIGWNGTRLSALPDPRISEYSPTDGLACPSARLCMSVGDRRGAVASAARFSHGRWTRLRVPSPLTAVRHRYRHDFPLGELGSIACPSGRMCIAVGGLLVVRHGAFVVQEPMIERWDGRRWSAVVPPVADALLTSVSCPSARSCTAVGFAERPGGRSRAIAIRLRGDHSSALPVPKVRGDAELSSVSCRARGCVAVGDAYRFVSRHGRSHRLPDRGLILRSGRGGWTARQLSVPSSITPTPKRFAEDLVAVSCPPAATSSCVAVGARTTGLVDTAGLYATIARGSVHQGPLPLDHDPTAIACPTATFCLAGGNEAVERLDR